jgi:hypothetical protein
MAKPPQPSDVQQPSEVGYESSLRVIGRHFDLQGCRQVAIFQTHGGFIARAVVSDARTPIALEFQARELPALLAQARSNRESGVRTGMGSPLMPTGYEDCLRALGYALDDYYAAGVMLCELRQVLVVTGVRRGEAGGTQAYIAFEEQLHAQDIEQLLNDAFARRSQTSSGGFFKRKQQQHR